MKDILHFRSLGLNQSSFVRTIFPSFRFSLYLRRNDTSVLGRALVSTLLYSSSDEKFGQVFVLDRLGSLEVALSSAEEFIKNQQSVQLYFGHYTFSTQAIKLRFVVDKSIAPALALLSSTPSVQDLIDHTISQLSSSDRSSLVRKRHVKLLLNLLDMLEKVNYITFRNDIPLLSTIEVPNDTVQYSPVLVIDDRLKLKVEKAKKLISMNFPENIIKKSLGDDFDEVYAIIQSKGSVEIEVKPSEDSQSTDVKKSLLKNLLEQLQSNDKEYGSLLAKAAQAGVNASDIISDISSRKLEDFIICASSPTFFSY